MLSRGCNLHRFGINVRHYAKCTAFNALHIDTVAHSCRPWTKSKCRSLRVIFCLSRAEVAPGCFLLFTSSLSIHSSLGTCPPLCPTWHLFLGTFKDTTESTEAAGCRSRTSGLPKFITYPAGLSEKLVPQHQSWPNVFFKSFVYHHTHLLVLTVSPIFDISKYLMNRLAPDVVEDINSCSDVFTESYWSVSLQFVRYVHISTQLDVSVRELCCLSYYSFSAPVT